ncbi:Mucolipin-3 [Pseudolycoriella hygida]|uniref:Mucolipin-3 n=1 Tax=Pseudolycoriella hygida TaxID=35572 RepID=A0A9Q0NA39_9DIPT|nr:Mucolipin-3 [Pseudolycoriella hygida]
MSHFSSTPAEISAADSDEEFGEQNRIFIEQPIERWDATEEVESYPPSIGPLALYIQSDFYDTIDYAIAGYSNLSIAIGTYSYPNEDNTMPPLKLCLYQYKEGVIFGFNESYIFNSEIDKSCINLTGNVTAIGTEKYLASKGVVISFSSLVKATLAFSVKTVNFKVAGPIAPPDCYQFDIEILFDNTDHDGQMLLALDAEPIRLHCKGDVEYTIDSEIDAALRSILNTFVIIICLISFCLCTRAIYRAQLLRNQTVLFFRETLDRELSLEGKLEFINCWYCMIILNDLLLVIGSAMKEQIERTNFTADEWNTCSVLLGIGNLLVWFGVLRYLGFFKTYNVVILTLKRAAPKITRFLLCALLIYAGFTFCGWLVLGPYHIKFRSLATTSECLFALINGDDMFATFTTMSSKSDMLWWFSRIYLYSFISLYIYVVLSLFISVIMDAYDTIKKYYKDGFPVNDLKQFMGTMTMQDFSSGIDDDENESDSLADTVKKICCCGRRPNVEGPTGYTELMNARLFMFVKCQVGSEKSFNCRGGNEMMNIPNCKDKIDSSNCIKFHSSIFIFYEIFCSFGYYTFLIPYKFVLGKNGYEVYTNNLRKVSCVVVHFFILVLGVGNLRKKFAVPKIVDKPNQFFIIAEGICLFIYIIVFIQMVITKKNVFSHIINSSTAESSNNKKNTKYRRIAIVMHLLAIFSCVAHLYADTFYGHVTFYNFIRYNAGKFYYGFHLRDSDLPLDESETTTATMIFTLFCLIVKIFLRLSSHFTELSFYIGAISIGLAIKNFLQLLSSNHHLPLPKIIECYEDMKLLTEHINSICGGVIIIVFGASIPHFARDSIAIFDSSDWWLKLDYVQYAFLYLASLTFAAEATNNMKQFTEYLTNYTKNVKSMTDPEKLTMILLEIQSVRYPIGLEGYGFFTVTYKFLGSMINAIAGNENLTQKIN